MDLCQSESDTIASVDLEKAPRWVIAVSAALFLMAGGAVAAWSVELPYYAYSPGPVGDALGAVVVDPAVTTYDNTDGLFLLTVSAQEVNVFEMIAAGLDPAVDVVRRERVRPADLSDEEFRQRGLSQMDQAIENAISEALRRLGDTTDAAPSGIRVADLLRQDNLFVIGDLLVSVAGTAVSQLDQIRPALDGAGVGDVVSVSVLRQGGRVDFEVDLIPSPDDPTRALLGIVAQTDFPIDILTDNIGGPSAGMIYTLAIIDLLSPGDLAHGHIVAGTGTIGEGGAVGPIGGVRQKVVAAEAAGADVMLVPQRNYEEALTAPRNKMELVPIETIEDALAYLAALPPV